MVKAAAWLAALYWFAALLGARTSAAARTARRGLRAITRPRQLAYRHAAAQEHNDGDVLFHVDLLDDEAEVMEEDEDAPHPLRTAEWRMSTRKLLGFKREDEYFTFHKDGTVESPGKADGRWWFDVGGLHWELKEPSATATHYRAELHWNIFGTQPRMFRGTVTRDRSPSSFMPPWLLRPVISTFTGYGIGDDTADTTYKHRSSGEPASAPRDRRFDRH